jgi:hypothetical protein
MTRTRPVTALILGMLAAAVVLAATALTGCGGSGHVTRAQCAAQYRAWQGDPAAQAAARSLSGHLTDLDLAAAVPDARTLEALPMPACADPAGYWAQIMRRIIAAGDNSGLGIGYIAEQTQAITGLEGKLGAELKRTTGTG